MSLTPEQHAARIRQCTSCGAPIVWLMTQYAKPMPTNADTVTPEDSTFSKPRHVSHFATCPNADNHRKKRG
jgi:hypothetical protein